jgi:hypothetical protein
MTSVIVFVRIALPEAAVTVAEFQLDPLQLDDHTKGG